MRRLVLAAMLLLGSVFCAYGQSTFATITGNVTDSSGAALPGVQITAVHKTLGLKASTQSNEAGLYTLADLREGEYTLQATAQGFKEFVADNIMLASRAMRRLDMRLEVGNVVERIEVTAEKGAAIETERAVLSTIRTGEQLVTTATNPNSLWYAFMTLPMTQPRGSSPSFAGSRNDQYQMSIDGATLNSGTGGVTSNLAGQMESFKEMKVEMVNTTAEHSGLGHVILIAKSGDNQFHASAFENYQSPSLRARDFFSSTRTAGINHQYGFGGGGPLTIPKLYRGKDRTFWYVNYDTTGASKSTEELMPTVPLEAWRRGDFSGLGVQIRNPLNGDVYRDGKIPAQFINPISNKIQEIFYPLPNVGDTTRFGNRNYYQTFDGPPSSKVWHGTARLDQRITNRDYFYASYGLHQVNVNGWDGDLPAFGRIQQKRGMKSLAFSHTRTFSPNLLNAARFTHLFNNNPRRGPLEGREVASRLGLAGLIPNLPEGGGVPVVSFSGLGLTTITQTVQQRPGALNKVRGIQDDLSYFRGRHNLKFGTQIQFIQYANQTLPINTFGQMQFSRNYSAVPGVTASGHPYADFLFGLPTSVARSSPEPLEDRRRGSYDFYVQDDWKLSSRVTVNLGVRYEYHAPWHEASGLMSRFDPATGQVVVADAGMPLISPNVPDGYVSFIRASKAGLPPTTLINSDKNNFGPRAGIAWRPTGSLNTVVRAGYGITYDMTPFVPSSSGSPFVVTEPTFTNTPTPTVVLPQVFPSTGSGKPSTVGLPSAYNLDLKTPYTQQWNFTLEHQRWGMGFRGSYVGTATRQMWWGYNLNSPVPDAQLFINKARPFPKYPGITYTNNGASHTYQAMSLEASRRLRNGPQIQASYTWARDLGDDVSVEDAFNRRRERGPDTGTPNQRFVASVIYQLPFGRGNRYFSGVGRPVDKVIRGWEMSVVSAQQTGQHLTPMISMPDPTGTTYTTSATRPTRSIRPDVIRDPTLPNRSEKMWYDINAFAAPPIGRYGNAGRGIITGPGLNVFHFALFKSIPLTDRSNGPRFRIGLNAENVFNHTNFASPNMTVSSVGTGGTISGTGGPNPSSPGDSAKARLMFLRLRFDW